MIILKNIIGRRLDDLSSVQWSGKKYIQESSLVTNEIATCTNKNRILNLT